MARNTTYQPEQVVKLLRQIEVAVENGKVTAPTSMEAGIVEQTYFRWRKEAGSPEAEATRQAVVQRWIVRPALADARL